MKKMASLSDGSVSWFGAGRDFLRAGFFAPLLLTLLLVTPSALAQSNAALAEALFNQGRDAFGQKDYAQACQKFRESYRIDPALGTQLNLAACEAERGHVATAWGLFRAVQQKLSSTDPRQEYVAENLKQLEPRVPHVVFRLQEGAPADTEVNMAGTQIGSAGFGESLPVDPGRHQWEVRAAGHETRMVEFSVEEGKIVELLLAPGEQVVASGEEPEVAEEATPQHQEEANRGFSRRSAAWVFGGVGVLSLAAGTVFGVLTLNQKKLGDRECPSAEDCTEAGAEALDHARTYRLASNIGWALSAVSLGAATYCFFTSSSEAQSSASVRSPPSGVRRLALSAATNPGGASLQLKGQFF